MRSLLLTAVTAAMACSSPSSTADAGFDSGVVVEPRRCTGCDAIRHATVLDADGTRTDRRVLIRDGGIVAEEPESNDEIEGLATTTDAMGHTLIPGLWDSHVHLMSSVVGNASPAFTPEALKAFVYSGVTSVLDMGSAPKTVFSFKQRIASQELIGPNVFAVGPFVTVPGGHPCPSYQPEFCAPVGSESPAATVVDAVAALQPDLLKLIVESGGAPVPTFPRISASDIVKVTAESHTKNLRVVAHISRAQDLDDALDAGVDILAHVIARDEMTDAEADRVVAANAPSITTLSFYDGLPRVVDAPADLDLPSLSATVPPALLAQLKLPALQTYYKTGAGVPITDAWRTYLANMTANIGKLHARNATLIAGSDCGNFAVFHGQGLVRELELLVGAGLSIQEAVTSATATPAALFHLGDTVGRVKAGQRADLVLVNGDLTTDITALRDVSDVWLGGAHVDRAAMVVTTPRTTLIKQQSIHANDTACVDDSECNSASKCHPDLHRCRASCALSACAANEACVAEFCTPSDACSPLTQNCPYSVAYDTTCAPGAAGFTECITAGTRQATATCAATSDCSRGLVCSPDSHCEALCNPNAPVCAAATTCFDETTQYGQSLGLCR